MNGISYYEDVLSPSFKEELYRWITNHDGWEIVRKGHPDERYVMQYGSKYLYDTHKADVPHSAPLMPPILKRLSLLVNVLCNDIPHDFRFTQCIINRYLPEQFIDPHIDLADFGPIVASFTIGKDDTERCMLFTKDDVKLGQITKVNSLYVLTKEARYEWKHQMLPNQNEFISITFRNMPLQK